MSCKITLNPVPRNCKGEKNKSSQPQGAASPQHLAWLVHMHRDSLWAPSVVTPPAEMTVVLFGEGNGPCIQRRFKLGKQEWVKPHFHVSLSSFLLYEQEEMCCGKAATGPAVLCTEDFPLRSILENTEEPPKEVFKSTILPSPSSQARKNEQMLMKHTTSGPITVTALMSLPS